MASTCWPHDTWDESSWSREHNAPVVLFTGSATLDPITAAEADGVVPKPFRLEQLLDVVRALAPHR